MKQTKKWKLGKRGRDRMQAIVDRITANPECWDQAYWHNYCRSTHCIAGHAQLDAGLPADGDTAWRDALDWFEIPIYGVEVWYMHPIALWLFSPFRTLDDFRELIRFSGKIE